jgi:hypothetical protein
MLDWRGPPEENCVCSCGTSGAMDVGSCMDVAIRGGMVVTSGVGVGTIVVLPVRDIVYGCGLAGGRAPHSHQAKTLSMARRRLQARERVLEASLAVAMAKIEIPVLANLMVNTAPQSAWRARRCE